MLYFFTQTSPKDWEIVLGDHSYSFQSKFGGGLAIQQALLDGEITEDQAGRLRRAIMDADIYGMFKDERDYYCRSMVICERSVN